MKMKCTMVGSRWNSLALALAVTALCPRTIIAEPFSLQGPGVHSNDFRVTTFARGLEFPMGMAKLPDDSLLVTISQGTHFFNSTGKLFRFTDTNQDGIADGPGTVLYSGLPASLTAVRLAGNLVIVMGVAQPITVLRVGASPSDPLTFVGRILINYPSGWTMHNHSALRIRKTPGQTNQYDMFFQVGAEANFANTTRTATLTNDNIAGANGILQGDSLHMLTLTDHGTNVSAGNLKQIASGLRNPAGMAFHSATGDLYFQDNGIDGASKPLSADELNFIARTNLAGATPFFGFPSNYTVYRTNTVVGGAGLQPLIAFQPIPDPFSGRESVGPNDITFAPPAFPTGLNSGIFLGFHGVWASGGTSNALNPLVYADPETGAYFHFILGQQPGIGHMDGLLATRDSLFVADFATNGNMYAAPNGGVIYQIKSLVAPTPPTLSVRKVGAQIEIKWNRGTLQAANDVRGPWSEVVDAFSPYLFQPTSPGRFFRSGY